MEEAKIVSVPKHKFDQEKYDNTQSLEEKRDYIENLAREITVSIGFVGAVSESLMKLGVKTEGMTILLKSLTSLSKGNKAVRKEVKKLRRG